MKKHYPVLFTLTLVTCSLGSYSQARPDSMVFQLGEVTVTGAVPGLFSSVDRQQLSAYHRLNTAQALNLLPGITLASVGPRNESVVFVRGFNLRQVPVLVDGIPVYVPYDGYVDLARFTTAGLARISVSKGNASVLNGPNTMGGAINLVTAQPVHRLQVGATAGWLNGGYEAALNAGGKWKKFYLQTGVSVYQQDYFNLPAGYTPTKNEDGGKRENAGHKDVQFNIKLAYTPGANTEYAVGFIEQQGSKGTPVYAGADTLNSLFRNPRYWTWPYWNKRSVYFLSNIQADSVSYIKVRAYYDQFRNKLNSYDDATYSTQTRPYAFTSIYNDHTIGANAEYGHALRQHNTLRTAIHFKRDVHKENNVGEPVREMTDHTFSWSVSDEHRFAEKWALQAGAAWNFRRNEKAEDYNSQSKTISNFEPGQNHAWNAQASLTHLFSPARSLAASVGRMTRLATIKDRYSYRMGTAVPNPDLAAENATHYELSYNDAAFHGLQLQGALFYSRIGNVIQSVNNVRYDTTADRWLSQMQNTGRAAFWGGEAAAAYVIAPGFHSTLQYSFIKRRNLDNPEIYFTDVPEHKLTASAAYRQHGHGVTLQGEYNSSRYSTSYGAAVSPFFLLHASAQVQLRQWLQLGAGVNNILDRQYELVEGYPEQGRNYFVRLTFNAFIP
ncbi:TonB-dependent receptor plug domain-containing protein [Chitinophaga alhagiae]|nr:TonB-dependent receptor plug domain-containing protein [Chitinophaga alhagiae]